MTQCDTVSKERHQWCRTIWEYMVYFWSKMLFQGPGSVNTRSTLVRGKGFVWVAERLPRPVPALTLPATRTGWPDPCNCLYMGHPGSARTHAVAPFATPLGLWRARGRSGRAHQRTWWQWRNVDLVRPAPFQCSRVRTKLDKEYYGRDVPQALVDMLRE